MELEREDINDGATVRFRIDGDLNVDHAQVLHEALEEITDRAGLESIVVDFSGLDDLDSAGVAVLSLWSHRCARAGQTLRVDNASPAQAEVLDLVPSHTGDFTKRHRPGLFESMGELVAYLWRETKRYYDTLTDSVIAFLGLFRGRFPPKNSVTEQSTLIGVDALPIVGLLSFLLGLIIAFQSAYQLRQFGANIYVADLVVISMVREFGPMMAGIMLAGRSGSAIAAELSTMRVQEEIDALRTMGIDPSRYLILPRLLAITIVMPLLTVMANLLGTFGGYLIGTMYLDLSTSSYINQTLQAVTLSDLFQGLSKSVIFAWIIGTIACYAGFNARGGASEVGRATTKAVVASIFMIIVADSIVTTTMTLLEG
ncbi:MAG: MlaE family lipid ABC transporter permease subunit [Persicimonas sp.]